MAFELIVLLVVIAFVAVSGFVAMLFITWPISKNVYNEYLVRTSADKWNRTCSAPDNEEQMAMWNEGARWAEANKDYMKEVCVCNDGFKLFGEYYDFGFDSCAIILSGRCESLGYSYYFAKPYMDAGLNVLVIDARCHGKSEGKWITFGVKEKRDCISWCNHLIKTFGDDIKVVFDGLSMGATTVLMAASEPDIPKNVVGIMADCGFSSPFDIVAHVAKKDMHIPKFPLLYLMIPAVKLWAGFSLTECSTVESVKKTTLPIFYIHGLDDDFVPHEMSLEAYDARPENSRIFIVPGAKHGLSYIIDEEGCSKACEEFLLSVVNDKNDISE